MYIMMYSTAVFCKHGERRRHLRRSHPSSAGSATHVLVFRKGFLITGLLYSTYCSKLRQSKSIDVVEEGSNARVRVLGPRLARFGRFAEISGAMFQKVSGDAIPFACPKNKAHCSHHDLFSFHCLVDAHWSAISARIEDQSRDLVSPSETRPSATFPAWADVVMEVRPSGMATRTTMAAPTGHVRDAAVMQTTCRARVEWNETP